jgi:acyl dehydratase
METKYFDDLQEMAGESFETSGRTITETDIVQFAGFSNEFHPVHVDAEFAADTKYGERIAHGPLVLSIGVGLTSDLGFLERSAVALYKLDDVRFVEPVYIGDTVSATCTISKTTVSDSYEGGTVTLEITMSNQHDETVLDYDHVTLVQSQTENTESSSSK